MDESGTAQARAKRESPTSDEVSFDDDSIRAIIRGYSREVGVHSLEREIATVCRKVARNIAEGKPEDGPSAGITARVDT